MRKDNCIYKTIHYFFACEEVQSPIDNYINNLSLPYTSKNSIKH